VDQVLTAVRSGPVAEALAAWLDRPHVAVFELSALGDAAAAELGRLIEAGHRVLLLEADDDREHLVPSPADHARVDGAARRPRLSQRERAVFAAYASGLTLETTARRVGIRPGTARTYLRRVQTKYEQIGRPARTKVDLAARLHEDYPRGM